MKFEIIGDISKLDILAGLSYIYYSIIESKKIKLSKINKVFKFNNNIHVEVEIENLGRTKKSVILPQTFIRNFKIEYIISNVNNIDNEIKIITELINKKLNNY